MLSESKPFPGSFPRRQGNLAVEEVKLFLLMHHCCSLWRSEALGVGASSLQLSKRMQHEP